MKNDCLNGIEEIRVFAPATVSNVGSGFDVFGFALDEPGDEVILKAVKRKGVRIKKITGDDKKLSKSPTKNTVSVALKAMIDYLELDFGVDIELHKKMPLCSGLGSSAASAVAGVFALNSMLKEPLSLHQLLPFALEGEKVSSGNSFHADNVAPALFGGFMLVRSKNPVDVISIPVPRDFYCTILYPHIEISTSYARSILPKTITLENAISQWGNTAGLVAGLMKRDYHLIQRSIEDYVAEPVRSKLIPGFSEIKQAISFYDSFGFGISGSGPSMFALSRTKLDAIKIGNVMKKVFYSHSKIESDIFVSGINLFGPKILG